MTLARLAPSLGVLCLISLAQPASGAPGDAYILSQGASSFSTNCSLDAVEGVRDRLSGNFLWVRRAGKAFLIREERTLDGARALFAPLRDLDPEQQALARRQEKLESEQEAVDREQDEIEQELDRLSDEEDNGKGEGEREASTRRSLERRQRDLEPKRKAIEERERELDALERSIDAREDALEKKIEAKLWRLIDEAIASGVARPDEDR